MWGWYENIGYFFLFAKICITVSSLQPLVTIFYQASHLHMHTLSQKNPPKQQNSKQDSAKLLSSEHITHSYTL